MIMVSGEMQIQLLIGTLLFRKMLLEHMFLTVALLQE